MALRTTTCRKGESHAHVVQVAVGGQHALLLTDEGIVYSWGGSNEFGQLGRDPLGVDKEKEPSPIIELRKRTILQIACGNEHSLALSQEGILFAWGHNKAGQLGVKGFSATAEPRDLIKKNPTIVDPFNGEDGSPIVRSCSCGPESSACVTIPVNSSNRSEVYVWGAISYYMFGNGARYGPGENCATPVKLRGVPKLQKQHYPDQVALYKDRLACTVSHCNVAEDLVTLIASLKSRSSELNRMTRHRKLEIKEKGCAPGSTDGHPHAQLQTLDKEFRDQERELKFKIAKMEAEQAACKLELARVGRELTICDQQETALGEHASQLEMKKSEGSGGAHRAVDTQLSDIRHFKESNRRTKLQLLARRDALEQNNLNLSQDLATVNTSKMEVEGRIKLIQSLQRGGLGKDGGSSIDEGLAIALSKREELSATNPQTLAGVGRFQGFREVLAISDRALQDISSALKEVSSAISSSDGAIFEEVLEANLKLRKDLNAAIQDKLRGIEKGREDGEGMVTFFKEAKMKNPNTKPPQDPEEEMESRRGFGFW